jgi:hypothetical protein
MTGTIQFVTRPGGGPTLPIRYSREKIKRNKAVKLLSDKGETLFDGKFKRSPVYRMPIPLVETAK